MAQKKYVSLNRLSTFFDNLKELFATKSEVSSSLSSKADKSHTHSISNVTNLQSTLDGKAAQTDLNAHTSNTDVHFTAAERTKLSGIASGAQVNTITGVKGNSETTYRTGNINITKANIGLGNVDNTSDANKPISTAQQAAFDSVNSAIDTHTENTDIHVTTANKSNWNSAYTHSTSAHARTDATKVEDSTTNGNIKINGTETNVYSHPTSGVTAGTYKSVTVNAQGHVTGGSNPTTLSGYGITDGALKSDVTNHNTSTSAHGDIRELITGLTTRLNTLANSDDTTLDQMSEIVAYIKANKALIDSVTTNKVNVSDIVNNLTTNVTNKPLSAAQGVEIKRLIDALDSALDTHDANTTKHITSTERTNWNAAKTHADSAHAPSNAQPNQNAFSNIAVSGQPTVTAETTTDTVTFAGSNVSITTDATNDKVTFSVADGTVDNKGIVRLSNSYSSTYTDRAATPQAVKYAYDRAGEAYELAETKQDEITGAATTIAKSDLLTSRALVSNSSGKIAASSVTSTELEYLDGVTSNIQDQLDDKAAYSHTHSAAHITSGIMDAARLPDASDTKKGVVTTGTQSFAGNKTFTGKVIAAGITSNGNIGAGAANTYDVGTSLAPFKGIYTQDLYVDAKIVAGSVLDGGSFRRETEGTTSTKGVTNLTVGNYITKGKNGNAQGYITVYNENNGATILSTSHTTGSDYNLKFPAHGGTLVTTSDLESLASVATVTTAEYTALEEAQATNANTLYMLTDAEEEVIPQIQFITWEEND